MSGTVVLHVGTPKSGTTYLQRVLWRLRDELAGQGVLCPGASAREAFHAAIEVREVFDRWGVDEDELRGTWAALCAQARQHDGVSIISHELLAAATETEIARAWTHLEGQDVRLVVTARDLGRQVLSEWQERVKNGSTQTFADFAAGLQRQLDRGDRSSLFWANHDVAGLLRRWGSRIAPEHVHLVLAPAPGSDPAELWWRFGDAAGFDARAVDPAAADARSNETLGRTQIAVLRRVNEALDGRVRQPHYARVVKRQLAQRILAAQAGERPVTPAALLRSLQEEARGWVAEIESRGYTVHGDPGTLVPPDAELAGPHPDDVGDGQALDAAVHALADLLVEQAEARSARQGEPGRRGQGGQRGRRTTAPGATTSAGDTDRSGGGGRAGLGAARRAVSRRVARLRRD